MSKKQIKAQQQDFLKLLSKMRDAKDIDAIADLFWDVISLYGLKMDETSALLYYIQDKTIKDDHNARFLKNNLNLDVTTLGVDGVLQVQRALLSRYVDKVKTKKKC